MSDIVERFKARALWDGPAWLEAAAEIERLREALRNIAEANGRDAFALIVHARAALSPPPAEDKR